MRSPAKFFYLLTFTFVTLQPAISTPLAFGQAPTFEQCRKDATEAVLELLPFLRRRVNDFTNQIDFDCKEAGFISSTEEPPIKATTFASTLIGPFDLLLHLPSFNHAMSILKPYCRSDETYGPFCMATDIDAAHVVSKNSQMVIQLPEIVSQVAATIWDDKGYNLVDIVRNLYQGSNTDATLLAGFIGLDDNGIQFDRLRANLLWTNRYEEYARIFMISSRYAYLGDLKLAEDLDSILFATRMGKLTLPGLQIDGTKTYKAFAGLYLGCRLAATEKSPLIVGAEAAAIGAAYELLKIRWSTDKEWREFNDDAQTHSDEAKRTAIKMSTGAVYGFNLCALPE